MTRERRWFRHNSVYFRDAQNSSCTYFFTMQMCW